MDNDFFNSRTTLRTSTQEFTIYALDALEKSGLNRLDRLPFSLRTILEAVLRRCDGDQITPQDVLNLFNWQPSSSNRPSMAFYPGRVVLQDFTGVPVMNDLAAMRAALMRLGGDPARLQPVIPVDLVVDHSIQVDVAGVPEAFEKNIEIEFERNQERYKFLRWCQKAFQNFRVVPPATGIIHQVNLEFLARLVLTRQTGSEWVAFPDTVVGTDSHTTMINGLGVVGWGVGGIEAVAAMLDQPIELVIPDVIGFKLTGALPEGVTPTDLTLTITQILRKKGVVDQFVEFFGPGLDHLSLVDRAMIANMSPENGATMTFFPVDSITLEYLKLTGRPTELIELVERYYRAQRLFRITGDPEPEFSSTVELDLATVQPSLSGPRRPQDRLNLASVKSKFLEALPKPRAEGGFGIDPARCAQSIPIKLNSASSELRHGSVVVAAITSCTNTSNPTVMLGAGLLAKKAVEKGLKTPPHVKTSLAPGSRVVTAMLKSAGVDQALEQLGFHLVGYGCTTCIGNSGPLAESIQKAIESNNLVAAAVLSGNRNFEGRISPHAQANYLASPPLVVAYALAGRIDIDLVNEPLGTDSVGKPVFLRDVWPSSAEVQSAVSQHLRADLFAENYASVFDGSPDWDAIQVTGSLLYEWNEDSTYLQEPPFFMVNPTHFGRAISNARVLAIFGNSVTTDHISPAGDISPSSAAGKYLIERGVPIHEFNSFGARRGNDRVMTRGTFGNIRIKNLMLPGVEGSLTIHYPDKTQMSIYDAAMRYQEEGVPLVVLAGKEYGTGSSRDWAAKGPLLLGVRAVIAESFERIHRSNLAGMGVLPLQFINGQNAATLGFTGAETFNIPALSDDFTPRAEISIQAIREDGSELSFPVMIRLDTASEVRSFRNGGLLNNILIRLARS